MAAKNELAAELAVSLGQVVGATTRVIQEALENGNWMLAMYGFQKMFAAVAPPNMMHGVNGGWTQAIFQIVATENPGISMLDLVDSYISADVAEQWSEAAGRILDSYVR